MTDLSQLDTERVNLETVQIDKVSTREIAAMINREDKKVALAVEEVLPEIAAAIDAIYARMKEGGRLIYCGAGTSGRIGVLDASECPPTYGVPEGLVVALMAGGATARGKAVEGAEDHSEHGAEALRDIGFTSADALVGLAASGRTPYVLGAMEYARTHGGLTVGLACTREAELARFADIMITPLTGAEVIAGSTRMKAGTSQKMVVNMISTGVMIKLGKVYGNRMVDVKATNVKLLARAKRMVAEITGASEEDAAKMLETAEYSVKHAVFMLLAGENDYETAKERLARHGGRIADALAQY